MYDVAQRTRLDKQDVAKVFHERLSLFVKRESKDLLSYCPRLAINGSRLTEEASLRPSESSQLPQP
jgi:hypothetical protein